jgi:hypothetical protein
MWSAVASEARHRFGSGHQLVWRFRAQSPLFFFYRLFQIIAILSSGGQKHATGAGELNYGLSE